MEILQGLFWNLSILDWAVFFVGHLGHSVLVDAFASLAGVLETPYKSDFKPARVTFILFVLQHVSALTFTHKVVLFRCWGTVPTTRYRYTSIPYADYFTRHVETGSLYFQKYFHRDHFPVLRIRKGTLGQLFYKAQFCRLILLCF